MRQKGGKTKQIRRTEK